MRAPRTRARANEAPDPAPATQPATAPAPAEPAAEPAAALDLRGVVVSSGGGFAIGGGGRTGGSGAGTIRAPASQPRAPSGSPMVAIERLSSPPRPPLLDGALARNYPPALRARGVEGEALFSIAILSDGRVGDLSAVSASDPAFADACRRTLRGARWSPPRVRAGHAVATRVRFRCRFETD